MRFSDFKDFLFNVGGLIGKGDNGLLQLISTESEIPIVEVGIRPGEKLYEELLVSTELVDNQVMDKIFVGKVNVMPLEAIDQKIEEFRTLSGDELKQAIIAFANQTTHVE